MTLRLVERVGPVRLASLQSADWALSALPTQPSDLEEWGDGRTHPAVEVRLAVEHAHLFDRDSGLALAHSRTDLRPRG